MNIKYMLLAVALVACVSIAFKQHDRKKEGEPSLMVSKAAEYKAKSREKIKPYRYDGSKISYFNYMTFEQKKSIEVLLFNGIDYKFCFNTDGVPKSIDIEIYDRDELKVEADRDKRILLYEAKGVMQKDVLVTSAEMLKALQAKKPGTSLKKIFIEYIVPIGDKAVSPPPTNEGKKSKDAPVTNPQEQGIVVVSYGYKNI
ncbi:MAG TPA: hypothetical protein VD905_09215 [Flavobacteriales bacterium]|nr:hypothetical protein [Flavobacteriales bacterium]